VNERVAMVWLLPCNSSKRFHFDYTHYIVPEQRFIEDGRDCLCWPNKESSQVQKDAKIHLGVCMS
jgi:hypothetical protein